MPTSEARANTINLGAGPSVLPTEVLEEAATGILDYHDTGMGVTELSHRSSTFQALLTKAEEDLRALLDIPPEYAVLFLQGGGTEQFSATLLNLLAAHTSKHGAQSTPPPVDYVVTGAWSNKAVKEARRLHSRVNIACDLRSRHGDASAATPAVDEWKLSPLEDKPAMFYYCDNETIDGYEMPRDFLKSLPEDYRKSVPIVADCSSNVLSRPIDVRAHAIIYFGAQKNIGPSGLTMAIVRRDLVVDPDSLPADYRAPIPTTLVYKNQVDNGSLYNTPPMFPIYVSSLVFAKLLKEGGVAESDRVAKAKSDLLYQTLLAHPQVFKPVIAHEHVRSRMNVTFRVLDKATGEVSPDAEDRLVKHCAAARILQVKGHRSVGGIRTSIYSAVTLEQVKKVAEVLDQFAQL